MSQIATTPEQNKRLINAGVSTGTADWIYSAQMSWTISALWDLCYSINKKFEFSTSMTSEELIENLVTIIVNAQQNEEMG